MINRHLVNTFVTLVVMFPGIALATPLWEKNTAVEVSRQWQGERPLKAWLDWARQENNSALEADIKRVLADSSIPAPARERLLYEFAAKLGDLSPGSVNSQVMDLLVSVQSQTLVPHEDHPTAGVPLFNIASAALGSQNRWRRMLKADEAGRLASQSAVAWPEKWLERYSRQDEVAQKGYLDSLLGYDEPRLLDLEQAVANMSVADPAVSRLAAHLAVLTDDLVLARRVLLEGHSSSLPGLLRSLATQLADFERLNLLEWVVDNTPATTAALANAILVPKKSGKISQAQPAAGEARIVRWVEDAPESDASVIALGYPVPMPEDTHLPFSGFRSYNGLNTRHQQLADTTPWVHPHQIGTTTQGRTIWAYRLGDADRLTRLGHPEPAMLSNGGIHAREWQSPEVTTGIMEVVAETNDNFIVDYLRDNANIIVIPVLNIDGFLQTQRFPDRNWLGTDINEPDYWPRDGRMRRKNMRGADEDLATQADHLQGIDLNRNNSPYWNTNIRRSSPDSRSLVHHGQSPQSEPETQALDAAAQLGPADHLSMYTDLHSFSQVHFWVRNNNDALANETESLLRVFSGFHQGFPAGKWYDFNSANNVVRNQGIGSTDEYFTHTYQVPSWTLEIEPRGNDGQHGIDYGGLGRNGHDGFILPESEVPRVRTQLAETFAIAYYRQSGPPHLDSARIVDDVTGAVVYQAEWDGSGETERELFSYQAQALQAGRDYTLWLAWNKPMRWLQDGLATRLPGTLPLVEQMTLALEQGDQPVDWLAGEPNWLSDQGMNINSYRHYIHDALNMPFNIPEWSGESSEPVTLVASAYDMSGVLSDPEPSTVARWANGGWAGYENDGGEDRQMSMQLSSQPLGDPFTAGPGLSSAWFDPDRVGEGFILEMIDDGMAVMYWFTYDESGNQDWLTATGYVQGNQVHFAELIHVTGGVFGPDFEAEAIERTVVGHASFTWSSCDSGIMQWQMDKRPAPKDRGRMELIRLTRLALLDCSDLAGETSSPIHFSGSWYNPEHSGEGITLEVLDNDLALAYWFSFDAAGNLRWFFGVGTLLGSSWVFDEMYTTRGAAFGDSFDPAEVELRDWGSMTLELDCSEGSLSYQPKEPGFSAGNQPLTRLTDLAALSCVE